MAQPDLILTPFGANAPAGNIDVIPETLSPSDPPQKASWQAGFPPVTMIPLAAGGIPPRGQDFNGVLNAISEHTVFQGAGGQYKWDDAYVAANGGYPKDAVLQSDDGLFLYISAVDGNSDNFNADPGVIGTSWLLYAGTVPSVNAREWTAETVSQAEAEAGTSVTRRAWTAQRVFQALRGAAANATETLRGTLRLGTQDEVKQLALANVAVSPAALGAAMDSHVLGMGQEWTPNLTTRALATVYTNTTGRTICVAVSVDAPAGQGSGLRLRVNGSSVQENRTGGQSGVITRQACFAIVPHGSTYEAVGIVGNETLSIWREFA